MQAYSEQIRINGASTTQQALEQRARRMAKRRDLRLRKFSQNEGFADTYGHYLLSENNAVVACGFGKFAKWKPRNGKERKTVDLTSLLDDSSHERSRWNTMPGYAAFSHVGKSCDGKTTLASWVIQDPDDARTLTFEGDDIIIRIRPRSYWPAALNAWATTSGPILAIEKRRSVNNEYIKELPLNAVPVASPFRKKEWKKIWDDFISLFSASDRSDIHDLIDYDS